MAPSIRDRQQRESVLWGIVEHAFCRAAVAGSEDCENAAGIRFGSAPEENVASKCRELMAFAAFARASLSSDKAERLREAELCRRLLAPHAQVLFRGDTAEVCSQLGRAYRSGYTPLCSSLASGPLINPSLNLADFHYICRLAIYPVYGCSGAKRAMSRGACDAKASLLAALKSRRIADCGSSDACRALLGEAEESCANSAGRVKRLYCSVGAP